MSLGRADCVAAFISAEYCQPIISNRIASLGNFFKTFLEEKEVTTMKRQTLKLDCLQNPCHHIKTKVAVAVPLLRPQRPKEWRPKNKLANEKISVKLAPVPKN